jgi:hypothetical protein
VRRAGRLSLHGEARGFSVVHAIAANS